MIEFEEFLNAVYEAGIHISTEMAEAYWRMAVAFSDIHDRTMDMFKVLQDDIQKLTELFQDVEDALDDVEEPRTFHKRCRPQKTRVGYPWMWVVPHPTIRRMPGGV